MSNNNNNNNLIGASLLNYSLEQITLAKEKLNTENIYKEESRSEITSPILRCLIEKGIKEEKHKIKISNEFNVLTKDEANKQLEELTQLKSIISKNSLDLNINEKLKSTEIELMKDDDVIKITNAEHSSFILCWVAVVGFQRL